ncbi:MAG TPA: M15 family metallopeptidase [Kofleriaceae bacterium]|nr:M15 family metallopeptidase [Kofleriaceae bacterium]
MAKRALALLLLAGACDFSPGGAGGVAGPDAGTDESPADDPDDPGDSGDAPADPVYHAEILPLSEEIRADMTGSSWHPDMGCPSLDDLALISLNHRGLDGAVHDGELVVAATAAASVAQAFGALFDAGFPIERIERVDAYGGDDDASMAANNTSAFNCRRVTGGTGLSQHSYGTAIDLNPVQNPYVRGDTVLPEAGEAYVERTQVRPGMVTRPSAALDAFAAIGWTWGGDWDDPIDYQHFSASGL